MIITAIKLGGLATNSYLCIMKKEITIPEQLHRLKPEELEAAARRRENYSVTRDLQAREFNDAILVRLAKEKELEIEREKEKERTEGSLSEGEKLIQCEKCGVEFSAGATTKGTIACPECNSKIKIE